MQLIHGSNTCLKKKNKKFKSVLTPVHYQVVENIKCCFELVCYPSKPSILANQHILEVCEADKCWA